MKKLFLLFLIACNLSIFNLNAIASDIEKETRWAEQIVDSLLDGEAIWLQAGQTKFLGLLTPAENEKHRAVILIHGTGAHPNWPQVIQPLRVNLTEHNWHTLSIQMPVLPNGASMIDYSPLYEEVAPRIQTAIKTLKQQGVNHIVLVAHSLGASMTAYYLSQLDAEKNTIIKGFIGIGMSAGGQDKRMNDAISIEKIHLPILDLYGSDDLDGVLNTVGQRAIAANKASNKQYSQIKIKNANHFFDDKEDALVKTVANWLEQKH